MIVFLVMVVMLRLNRRAGMVDEDILMFVRAFAWSSGKRFRRHAGSSGAASGSLCSLSGGGRSILRSGASAALVLDDILLFLFLAFRLGLGLRCDLEAFDVVFRAAAGFGFLFGDQRLTVGKGNLVIVGMDFREGEEALAVAAIFDKGGLQRRLDPRHFRQIDVALERPLGSGLEIKFLDLGSVENDHPGLFRVAGVDKHAFHEILRAARRVALRHAQRRAGRARGGGVILRLKGRPRACVSKRLSKPGRRQTGAQNGQS